MQNAAIYVRVSTDLQAEKGYSLETQIEACRKYAEEMGAAEITVFKDDGYSGEYIERPAMSELREAIGQKKFQVVVVYDPDRLARNLAHQLIITDEIEKSGAQLKFVSVTFEHSPEGKLFYSIRGAVSVYEKAKIIERVSRGKRGKLQQGKIIGDTKPFGYRFDHKSSNYIINEKEAQIVRHIYSWLVNEKIGTPGIAKRLNAKGFVSPRTKKPWTPNTIYYLIKQPRYMGTHIALTTKTVSTGINSKKVVKRPESEWIEVQVPAIVDELTWYAAQKQLRMNKMKSSRNQKKDHVLAGLIFCAKCGRKMKIEYSGRKPYPGYYVCNGVVNPNFRYAGGSRCDTRRIPCEVLENTVMDILENISNNPAEFEKYISRPSNEMNIEEKKNDLDRLKQREDGLHAQRKTILRWFQQKIIEEKDAEQQLKSLKRQQDGISDYKKSIIKEINNSPTPPEYTSNDLVEIVQNYFKDKPLTFEKQRELALTVISKVTAIRIDATTGRSSVPEIDVHLTFVGV